MSFGSKEIMDGVTVRQCVATVLLSLAAVDIYTAIGAEVEGIRADAQMSVYEEIGNSERASELRIIRTAKSDERDEALLSFGLEVTCALGLIALQREQNQKYARRRRTIKIYKREGQAPPLTLSADVISPEKFPRWVLAGIDHGRYTCRAPY